jgi:hypothetical protein
MSLRSICGITIFERCHLSNIILVKSFLLASTLRSAEFSFELPELIPSLIWFVVLTDVVRVDLDNSVECWDIPEWVFRLSLPIFIFRLLYIFYGPEFVIKILGAKKSETT